MLTFTPDLILEILTEIDSEAADDLELDSEELETIAERLTDNDSIQGKIADLL